MKETFPKSIEIVSRIDKDIWNIWGDFTQLNQGMLNLCVNARDAMPEGGKLTITAKNLMMDEKRAEKFVDIEKGPYVVITISDTGLGISSAIKDKIYDPFFTTKEPDKGTGLGLSTAWEIVKEHGGYIHLESEIGKGSNFVIYLPAIQTEEYTASVLQDKETMPSGKGETILVVDDETAVLDITRLILKEFGYNVIIARNGQEAIDIMSVQNDRVKLAIVDMMMPVMGGKVVVDLLMNKYPALKIISVSGYQKDDDFVDMEEKLTDAFLHKPFDAETLLQTIDTVMRAKPH